MTGSRADDAVRHALALRCLPGIGTRGWHAAVDAHGTPGAALQALALGDARDDALARADTILDRCATLGAHVLVHRPPHDDAAAAPAHAQARDADADATYPHLLHDLAGDAPPVLYALGDLRLLARPAVALVGTRHATPPGLRAAHRLARAAARAGAVVVSGLARGIDAAAHDGALDAGTGTTIAVLGTGIDVPYPADHRTLHDRIAREGLVLSELPPGRRATRGSFPERNRIVAALARVTVVVEAGDGSGALITAAAASDLGRDVAAVPGAFEAASCRASNRLLRDGAAVIADEADLLVLLGLHRAAADATRHERASPPAQLDDAERALWHALDAGPLALDELVHRAGRPAATALAALTTLELRGLVRTTALGALERA